VVLRFALGEDAKSKSSGHGNNLGCRPPERAWGVTRAFGPYEDINFTFTLKAIQPITNMMFTSASASLEAIAATIASITINTKTKTKQMSSSCECDGRMAAADPDGNGECICI
jgi:hypothetical protein